MNLSSIYINKNILYISKQKILPTFKVGDMIKVYSKINNTNPEMNIELLYYQLSKI